MLFWVVLALVSWTFCHGANEAINVFMEKRASFDNNLRLTSACYISEIEKTSRLRCFSQCLSRLDVCNGILFNQERKACKLIKCNPTDSLSGLSVDIGRWDLFWNTYGIHIFYKWLSISLYWSLSFNGKGSILSNYHM